MWKLLCTIIYLCTPGTFPVKGVISVTCNAWSEVDISCKLQSQPFEITKINLQLRCTVRHRYLLSRSLEGKIKGKKEKKRRQGNNYNRQMSVSDLGETDANGGEQRATERPCQKILVPVSEQNNMLIPIKFLVSLFKRKYRGISRFKWKIWKYWWLNYVLFVVATYFL